MKQLTNRLLFDPEPKDKYSANVPVIPGCINWKENKKGVVSTHKGFTCRCFVFNLKAGWNRKKEIIWQMMNNPEIKLLIRCFSEIEKLSH